MRIDKPNCQRRVDAEGWWICEHCGSCWHENIFDSHWRPLTCFERQPERIEQDNAA